MALTYVFLLSAPSGAAVAYGGTQYTANAAGIITGVAPTDALSLQGVGGASVQLLAATGATTDRPASRVATALTGAINNIHPVPLLGMPFYDTTLTETVYYVGTLRSSTSWVDQTGTAA